MVPTKRLVLEPFRYTNARLSSSSWFHLGYRLNPKLKRGVSLSLSLFWELALTRHIYIVKVFVDCCGPTTRKKKTKKTKKKEEENFELSPLPVT